MHSAELGASVAETFGKAVGPVHRQLCEQILVCSDYGLMLLQHRYLHYRNGTSTPLKFYQAKLRSRVISQVKLLEFV